MSPAKVTSQNSFSVSSRKVLVWDEPELDTCSEASSEDFFDDFDFETEYMIIKLRTNFLNNLSKQIEHDWSIINNMEMKQIQTQLAKDTQFVNALCKDFFKKVTHRLDRYQTYLNESVDRFFKIKIDTIPLDTTVEIQQPTTNDN